MPWGETILLSNLAHFSCKKITINGPLLKENQRETAPALYLE